MKVDDSTWKLERNDFNLFLLNQHNIKLFGFLFLKELRARFEFIWKELQEQDSIRQDSRIEMISFHNPFVELS